MNEKAEEKTEPGPELSAISGTRSPLAKVMPIDESRVDLFNPRKWGRDDIEVIKKTVCPAGIPDADFKLFIMKCQASGMNPLLGEAFCIKRNQNIGTKDSPKWIEVFQFTPGEQGMEGRADDFPDFRGLRAAAVYENDKISVDPSIGEVSHQFNPVDPKRGRLVGAWGIAYRAGRKTPVEYVRLDEYIDTRNPKWTSSPATMLVKCARAAALRRAYPNTFDGVFLREEIADDGDRGTGAEQTTGSQVEQANRDTTDRLADRMKATGGTRNALKNPGAQTLPASKSTVDVVTEYAVKTAVAATETRFDSKAVFETPPKAESPKTVVGMAELRADLKRYEIFYDTGRLEKDAVYASELVGKVDAARAAAEAKRAAPKAEEPKTPEPLPSQVAEAKMAEQAALGPLMNFGPFKSQPVRSLAGPDLLEQIAFGESKIGSLVPDKAARVRACIDQIKAVMAERERALLGDAPEPGTFDVD
jgi:phage recombination protein Bet